MATILRERSHFYFKSFPRIDYTFGDDSIQVLDFIHRWKIRDSVKANSSAWSKWVVRDEDTLLSMAETLYGSQHHYWVILMMNDILDPLFGWPLNERDLKSYVKSIYGADKTHDIHHWEAEEDDNLYSVEPGTIVSFDYPYNKISINNFDFEASVNEAKRPIKLLKPEYMPQLRREREKILSSNFGRNT